MNPKEFLSFRSDYDLETDILEIWALEGFETWRDNQVHIQPSVRLTESDCMAFVGLSVFVHTDHYTEILAENFEMLKKCANYIMVCVADFGEDLGFEWRKC